MAKACFTDFKINEKDKLSELTKVGGGASDVRNGVSYLSWS